MKPIYYLIVFLSALPWMGYAAERHVGMQYERVPFSSDELFSDKWDASSRSVVDDHARAGIKVSNGGVLTEYIGSRAEHYLFRGDTLLYRGNTDGNHECELVTTDCPALLMPILAGATIESGYNSEKRFTGRLGACVSGSLCSDVRGPGLFIIAPGDSLRAYLVHETRSIAAYSPDQSIINQNCTEEIWRWYAAGDSVAFAVQRRIGADNQERFFAPAEFVGESEEEQSFDASDIIDNASINITHGNIIVSLGQLRGVLADVYIVDIPGNIYGRSTRELSEENNIFNISTAGLQSGTYMLVIAVLTEEPLVHKQIVTL